MLIFIYTTLILILGLTNKVMQSLSGDYGISQLTTDLPLILLTYFGLVAIWGRAKQQRFFSEFCWRVYFVLLMVSLILVPVFDPGIQSMMQELGGPTAIVAYSVTIVVLAPYYWGLFSYAYGQKRIWAPT
ncbi:MAG: hypothetical protein WD071_09365 [Pseudohongiella sp.]|uniref:hypothetical protein n=1 Tax=Pseudohongiella sp. TaxID=1979412 RepID=UPI0034A09786